MFRVVLGLGVVLFAGVTAVGSAVAGDARTTRIEPRGFYGATVSIEAGVRVFRPLPRTTHVIINPNNTPLNLSIEESRHLYQDRTHRQNPAPDNTAGTKHREHAVPHYGVVSNGAYPVGIKHRANRHHGAPRAGSDRIR